MGQQSRDVVEQDSRPGEVGNLANMVLDLHGESFVSWSKSGRTLAWNSAGSHGDGLIYGYRLPWGRC